MPVLIVGALLVLALLIFWWLVQLAFGLVGLLLTLFIAGLIGWVADQIIPGELPYGWAGAVVAGLIGGLLGGILFGNLGPSLFGIRLIPTFLGALIVVGAAELVSRSLDSGQSRRALHD